MTTKSEKMLMQVIKAKHLAKYGAPFGKRKCTRELSDSCLGTASELNSAGEMQFRGRVCKQCRNEELRRYHAANKKPCSHKKKLGRPVGSKNKSKDID